jgi:hypothetical protein
MKNMGVQWKVLALCARVKMTQSDAKQEFQLQLFERIFNTSTDQIREFLTDAKSLMRDLHPPFLEGKCAVKVLNANY